jgi:predicted nucleic acid-binding protein
MSNSLLVVDANVVIKWFVPEVDERPAQWVREQLLEGEWRRVAPALLLAVK